MDANVAGVGKLGFTLRVPDRCRRRDQPVQLPAQPRVPQARAAIAAGLPGRAQAGIADAAHVARCSPRSCSTSAGLPPGWLNVVTGGGGTVGNALVDHPDVALITFTGSPEVGWGIKGRAPRKKVGLELGNNAPVIVEPDADLELAATKIVAGGYAYSGQTCISVQRVYAHDSVRGRARRPRWCPRWRRSSSADPLDDDTDVSALIAPVRARSHRRLDRGGRREWREDRDRR